MATFIHLSTCNTCQRIFRELGGEATFQTVQDVKKDPITPEQLDRLYAQSGSYEALFNRRSRQYRGRGLHEQSLTEADYRRLLLEEYTFLKRPVIWTDEHAYVGNSKKTVAAARTALGLEG